MSESTAEGYAERVGKDFWADHNAGHPFGVKDEIEHDEEDEEACEAGECECEPEPLDAYEFFVDRVYDIEYRIASDGTYRSAELMIAGGGPNVYIDTGSRNLEVYWGGHARWGLPSSLLDALDEIAEEQWDSLR